MALDYTKLMKKLRPSLDGEDTLTLRVGVVDAVNTDGTADVAISGIILTGVPRLAEASVMEGAVVQMISYRGSLMIIGRSADSAESDGVGMWARAQATSSQTAIGISLTALLTTASVTFIRNRVYEMKTHGGVSHGTANTYADLRVFKSAGAQLGEYYRFPITAANAAFNATGSGVYFSVSDAGNVTGAVQLQGSFSVAGGSHFASAGTPRNLEVYDVGDISKFPGVPTW